MIGKTYFFEISGSGKFPHRLLAEQNCFPDKNNDAMIAFERAGSNRTIRMKSITPPNVDLWRGYGWSIHVLSTITPPEDYTLYHTWPC